MVLPPHPALSDSECKNNTSGPTPLKTRSTMAAGYGAASEEYGSLCRGRHDSCSASSNVEISFRTGVRMIRKRRAPSAASRSHAIRFDGTSVSELGDASTNRHRERRLSSTHRTLIDCTCPSALIDGLPSDIVEDSSRSGNAVGMGGEIVGGQPPRSKLHGDFTEKMISSSSCWMFQFAGKTSNEGPLTFKRRSSASAYWICSGVGILGPEAGSDALGALANVRAERRRDDAGVRSGREVRARRCRRR
jgi:hypothetical protein